MFVYVVVYGCIVLGIEVDQEYVFGCSSQGGGQIDGGCGFVDVIFLVGDGDDVGYVGEFYWQGVGLVIMCIWGVLCIVRCVVLGV